MRKATNCLSLILMLSAIVVATTAKAEFFDNFETGYTSGVTIDGINGWSNIYTLGLTAYDYAGTDDGWGVKAADSGYMGSGKAHGVALDNGAHVVASADIRPQGHATLSTMYVKLSNPSNVNDYVAIGLTRIKVGFNCHDSTGWKFLDSVDTSLNPLADEFYHVEMDWTVGGSITGTVTDMQDNVIASWTEDLSGWAPSSSMTDFGAYGRRGAYGDNFSVAVPEPSMLALIGFGLLGLVGMLFRR